MDKCVLVVDDNDFNRELVRDILEDEDITVYEAEDGSSAIELLESEQADDIDAVLMDVRMPGMDGIETTKIIRTKNGKCTDVPIIAMTADGFGTEMEMLQKIGMNGLISKPVDVNTLVEQIKELAEKCNAAVRGNLGKVKHLDVGDMIFQYTDGVTEATNVENQLYGMERLEQVLNRVKDRTPSEILPEVKKDIDAFVGEAPQFDDITMLCVEYKAKMEKA